MWTGSTDRLTGRGCLHSGVVGPGSVLLCRRVLRPCLGSVGACMPRWCAVELEPWGLLPCLGFLSLLAFCLWCSGGGGGAVDGLLAAAAHRGWGLCRLGLVPRRRFASFLPPVIQTSFVEVRRLSRALESGSRFPVQLWSGPDGVTRRGRLSPHGV